MNEKEYIESIPMWAKKKNSLSKVKENIETLEVKLPKIVHVAGTNGKGSVCAYLSNILIDAGMKVGTFISPHLIEVNERILLDMKPISDEELEDISKYVREKLEGGLTPPTYFEYLFYIAAVHFSRSNLDIVILETGMGGRLDVTNIFDETLGIITSIGMDHMMYLGNTVKEIAFEKAGIIKKDCVIIFDDGDEESNEVIKEIAKIRNAGLIALSSIDYESFDFTYVNYKKKAAALAILAARVILNKSDIDIKSIKSTVWHGRMEEIGRDIIIDGAHNVPAIKEFVDNALTVSKNRNKKIKLLISIVKDKEIEEMFDIITAGLDVKKYYLTSIDSYRSNDIKKLYNSLNILLEKNKKVAEIACYNNVEEALSEAEFEKRDDEILFCVGSLYLIGEILKDDRF
nr:Mur ligase family protein [uncultured Lachnoanaerobaculum sp.]